MGIQSYKMLSVAIPTMCRWIFLKDILPVFLEHPAVAKVVLCDETGEDAAACNLQSSKLVVVVNSQRLGMYQNKRKAFELAAAYAPHVALVDSDNYFSETWIDTVVEELEKGDKKTVYGSAEFKSVVITSGEVTTPCKHFSGLRLDAGSWNTIFNKPKFVNLLNDGNLVIPSECVNLLPTDLTSEGIQAADSIFMLRCYVKGGYSVFYIPGLSYIHSVHDGSEWLKTEKASMAVLNGTNWRL
jgi:hypothetical protein